MSDDLVARLRHAWDERERQLAEDERVALEVPERTRAWRTSGGWPETGPDRVVAGDAVIAEELDERDAWHIARHDPARVLAEVERGRRDIAAKRRILDEHAHYPVGSGFGCGICSVDPHMNSETDAGWCQTVRLLAEAEGLA